MKWFIILAAIVVVFLLLRRAASARHPPALSDKSSDKNEPPSRGSIIRMGKSVEADDVFEAWTSGDLSVMVGVLECKTNPIDRHFLLMGIVDQTYKNRHDTEQATLLQKAAELHLAEFPAIKPALEQDMDGVLPRVTTFQKYATYLTEQGDYAKAIDVCNQAISYGLHDGTKSGYEGRIARIAKNMSA